MNIPPNPTTSHHEKRRQMTLRRNEKICERFRELYEQHRLRLDDVLNQLSDEFCLAPLTIERILSRETQS